MANNEHLRILKQGVAKWNQWRMENPHIPPDLSGANLNETGLAGANLKKANLCEATLYRCVLSESILTGADLTGVNLYSATVTRANLNKAILKRAYIKGADFTDAKLIKADLTTAHLVEANFEKANLAGSRIYGISAWDLILKEAIQTDLIITPIGKPIITVDNLEIAQFIYLLLNNEKIRYIIDTITTKVILILGRFTKERKAILDTIREELRKHDYVPVMFDFERPPNKDFIETVSTLAHLAKFVIADLTDPKIVLEEITRIAEIAVPIIPLLLEGLGEEPVTINNLRINHLSILDTHRYKNRDDLLTSLKEKVIDPAETKVKELGDRRNKFLYKKNLI